MATPESRVAVAADVLSFLIDNFRTIEEELSSVNPEERFQVLLRKYEKQEPPQALAGIKIEYKQSRQYLKEQVTKAKAVCEAAQIIVNMEYDPNAQLTRVVMKSASGEIISPADIEDRITSSPNTTKRLLERLHGCIARDQVFLDSVNEQINAPYQQETLEDIEKALKRYKTDQKNLRDLLSKEQKAAEEFQNLQLVIRGLARLEALIAFFFSTPGVSEKVFETINALFINYNEIAKKFSDANVPKDITNTMAGALVSNTLGTTEALTPEQKQSVAQAVIYRSEQDELDQLRPEEKKIWGQIEEMKALLEIAYAKIGDQDNTLQMQRIKTYIDHINALEAFRKNSNIG